jgi:hypothetical protein
MFANDPNVKNKAIVFISTVSMGCDVHYSSELKGRDLVKARHDFLKYVFRSLKNGIDSDFIQKVIREFGKQFMDGNVPRLAI